MKNMKEIKSYRVLANYQYNIQGASVAWRNSRRGWWACGGGRDGEFESGLEFVSNVINRAEEEERNVHGKAPRSLRQERQHRHIGATVVVLAIVEEKLEERIVEGRLEARKDNTYSVVV